MRRLIVNNYWDKHGRLHHKPVTEENPYPSNNSFLYSGYASLVGVPVDVSSVQDCFVNCAGEYGYNRNPDGEILPASSHDEIVGLFMLYGKQHTPENFYNQLKKQYFQVCNLPEFLPKPLYKLNPVKTALELYALSKEDSPRKSTYKYPYILPVTFRHGPQHTYFYKRCASVSVSWLHSLYYFFACLSTIFGTNNSSKAMLGFKLLKLQSLGLNFTEKLILTIYNKYVKFGDEVKKYFPEDHPITGAVSGRTKI